MVPLNHRLAVIPVTAGDSSPARYELIADVWSPLEAPKGRLGVILAHGLVGSRDSEKLRNLARRAAERGATAVLPDLSGMGASQGGTAQRGLLQGVRDIAACADYLKGEGAQTLLLVGNSMGAAKGVLYAGEPSSLPVSALFLLAPSCDNDLFGHLLTNDELARWQAGGTYVREGIELPWSLVTEIRGAPFGDALRRFKGPIGVVHGEADATVPLAGVQRRFGELPNRGALFVLPGADHRFSHLEDRLRVETLFDQFLDEYVADLMPAGGHGR